MISLIWAQTQKGVIGNKNSLPWSIPEEMKHFRATTLNSDILMGNKTFISMGQKPLPKRLNYVLSSNAKALSVNNKDNLIYIDDISDLIKKYKNNPDNKLYVIGGSQIFNLFFDHADEIIRTIIKEDYEGDVYIENFNYNKLSKVKQIDYDEFYIEYFERD
ncbi:dihydrofolate reductase [Mesoplasma photuris]|uniref:dihydrofolate reductase n=1 Tax=Mesoplasma photuris TaxID=217731 RepID=UPI0004E1C677|nr:dihydrofolate reductase [Mesoplasma photuris]